MFTREVSSRDDIIPVYGEMSLTVYTLLSRRNFILELTYPVKKTVIKFHTGINKGKKDTQKLHPGMKVHNGHVFI